jgi:hypothetical protein
MASSIAHTSGHMVETWHGKFCGALVNCFCSSAPIILLGQIYVELHSILEVLDQNPLHVFTLQQVRNSFHDIAAQV